VTRTRSPAARAILLACAAALGAGAIALAAPGDLSLVSVSSGETQGAAPAEASAVSADGRFVAFTSSAALTATATGGKVQLYVRDRTAGTTALASASAAGAASDGDVDSQDVANVQFSISGDGRHVVFTSTGANLSPADTDAAKDVFRKDMTTGAVDLVSVSSAGVKANGAVAGDPDISSDGTRVAFGSGAATNLAGTDGNAASSDVLVRDLAAGTTVLAAQTTAGVQANGTTERPAISADGHAVAFEAPVGTTNLAANDTGGGNDVFVRNLAAGTLSPASDPSAPAGSGFPDISGDGRFVVLETGQAYDATNDTFAGNDVYRRDMGTGAILLASARNGLDSVGNAGGVRPAIAADGTRVAFASTSTNLVAADGNAGVRDIFVRDVAARTTALASVRADGVTQGATDSETAAIAANGGLVAFVFNDAGAGADLIAGDANAQPDVHAKELAPSDAAGPSLTLSGPAEGAAQSADRIAVGGTATDPSGIVSVTVGGTALPVTATGGFSTTVSLAVGASTITVVARDGAGNTTTATRTVTRTAPVVIKPGPRARVLALSASLTKAGAVRVALRVSAAARVRVTLLRRTVRTGPRRVVLRRIGAPLTRSLTAGRRAIVFTPARRLAAGRYVVRVRFLTPVTGPATRSAAFRVARR
jgi:Tol biopolymer transport system component